VTARRASRSATSRLELLTEAAVVALPDLITRIEMLERHHSLIKTEKA